MVSLLGAGQGDKESETFSWKDLVNWGLRDEVINTEMDKDYLEKRVVKIEANGKEYPFYVSDSECIKAKAQAALFGNEINLPGGGFGNIGGVGAWQIGQDGTDSELTNALWEGRQSS